MDTKTIVSLSIGTGAMLVLIAILMLRYKIKPWKSIPVSILITIIGTIGSYVWFFIEESGFGSTSFYGAVFFIPLAFLYVAKIMNIPYGKLMDFCAPAGCVMLAVMKYRCFVHGCCGGIVLKNLPDGSMVLFPSQIVELINGVIIMVILLIMGFGNKQRGKLYAWFLVIYGASRFVLNWFRDGYDPLLIGLPNGNVWSLLAIAIGFMWLTNRRLKIVRCESEAVAE